MEAVNPPISMVAFDRELEAVGSEIEQAVSDAISSGWYVLGDNLEAFEARFAELVGVEYGIGVNSGTDALAIALEAVGVGPGDEVITVSHTATATVSAILMVGATPIYVDVGERSMVMDIDDVRRNISDETAAIIPVHLYGRPARMDELMEVATNYDVPIVEDCAQAHGATYGGMTVGAFGDAGAFSFYPTKNLGAYGDAGLVVTNDQGIGQEVRRRRQYGWADHYQPVMAGRNSRLDELQAAVLNVKVEKLSVWNDVRRAHAERYDELLAGLPLQQPTRGDESRHVFHQYVIQTDHRDALQAHLADIGVETQIHYPTPVHQQTGYASEVNLSCTDRLSNRILSLPIHPFLHEEEIEYVAEGISAFFLDS